MPRGRKGTGHVITDSDGNHHVRVSMPDGTRPLFALTKGCSLDEAKAEAAALSSIARTGGLRKRTPRAAPKHETCAEWWDRYCTLQAKKGRVTVKDARARIKNWVLPVLKGKTMHSVTPDDLREVVNRIDEGIASGAIKPKTGDNIWGDVTSGFRAACSSKLTEFRVREDNPTEKVEGPDGGVEREKPILYPGEIVALLSCESVPVERRRIYAVAIYTSCRSNELAALTATSFDLLHHQIIVDRQVDRETLDDKQTKTKRVRSFTLEAAVVPLLKALCDEKPKGRLLDMPPDEQRASLLREDLRTAGVTRAALFVDNDAMRLPMWFHHLRDTGLTMMAARGDDALKLQFRAGHTDFKMTQKYIARAKNLPPNFGDPFPPIPSCLLPGILPTEGGDTGSEPETEGVPNGIRRRSRGHSSILSLPEPGFSDIPRQPGTSKDSDSAIAGLADGEPPPGLFLAPQNPFSRVARVEGRVVVRVVPGVDPAPVSTFGELIDQAMDPSTVSFRARSAAWFDRARVHGAGAPS